MALYLCESCGKKSYTKGVKNFKCCKTLLEKVKQEYQQLKWQSEYYHKYANAIAIEIDGIVYYRKSKETTAQSAL